MANGRPLPPAPPSTQYQINSDTTVFQTINGFSDGQLHVGNARCPPDIKTALDDALRDVCQQSSQFPFGQFYKEYPAQVVLCVHTGASGMFDSHYIAPMSEEEKEAHAKLVDASIDALNAQALVVQALAAADLIDAPTRDRALAGHAEVGKEIERHGQVAQPLVDGAFAAAVQADSGAGRVASQAVESAQSAASAIQGELQAQGFAEDTDMVRLLAAQQAVNLALRNARTIDGTLIAAAIAALNRQKDLLQTIINQEPSASSGPPSGATGSQSGANGASPASSGSGAMPQVTLALQPSRVSGILRDDACQSDQIVLHGESEPEFDQTSKEFTHVEWRSIAEVIQYLGALLRTHTELTWESDKGTHTLFSVYETPVAELSALPRGRIWLTYRGWNYNLHDNEQRPADHSLQVLSLLNELINLSKISGSLPVSQPVQVLP